MTKKLPHKIKIGEIEYFVRQVTSNESVRFPETLSKQIIKQCKLKYGDAFGFRILSEVLIPNLETPNKGQSFLVEVIPLKVTFEQVK